MSEREGNVSAFVPESIDRPLVMHRVVLAGLFAALVWKLWYFVWGDDIYRLRPLADPFFPTWLQSYFILRVTFLVALIAIVMNFIASDRWMRRLASVVTFACLTILCIHQGSYNDATFTTGWWTSIWTLWFVHRMDDDDEPQVIRRAALLSRLILSMILLGGAVGKWTAEYWSGEVFFDIYFRDRDFWLFNLLRDRFDVETLKTISTWYSRKVIVIETACGFGLWLLPPKWAAITGVVVFAGIALLSNFLLFSVLLSLIALASVGWFVYPRDQSST